jgi:hypothetical protein
MSEATPPSTPHTCAAPGCSKAIGESYLMCYGHWQLVPKAVQAEVNRTWRAVTRGASDKHLNFRNRAAYMGARHKAITSITSTAIPPATPQKDLA